MRLGMIVLTALALLCLPVAAQARVEKEFTDTFPLADCDFKTKGVNPYFTLEPGLTLHLSNGACVADGDCDEFEEVWITVLSEVRQIELDVDGEVLTILTRVVEEYEEVDGELAEISHNYFAECRGTQDVYYFGEDVDIYDEEGNITHDGAWLAGMNGALPGIYMPGGAFLLGARYYQEIAPDVALDRAEHVGLDLDIEVPAGVFEKCVEVEETTPLEPKGVSSKTYCPGVGLVIDEDLELLDY